MAELAKLNNSEGVMIVTDYSKLKELSDKIMDIMVEENLLVHEAKFVIKQLKWDIKNHQYISTRQSSLDDKL